MKVPDLLGRLLHQERVNFLLTNRVPRRWVTRMVGRISKSERPWVARSSIALWRLFSDIDLSDARTTRFKSMHDCFIRQLKEGARDIDDDPAVMTSPCDGIVGAYGRISEGTLLQAKGLTYTLEDLLGDCAAAQSYRNGTYVTLRLRSNMYHRFHAPHDCQVEQVCYYSGDVWNVNPAAVKRVKRLYCKNERAVLYTRLAGSAQRVALVPVGAILVASIRFHFIDVPAHVRKHGRYRMPCQASFGKGQEMGWFEHGSTMLVIAPAEFELSQQVTEGAMIRMGSALMRLASS
jgi:phosphatidylserine decarboxylase